MSGSIGEAQGSIASVFASELARQPDPGGLALYTALLMSGGTLDQVRASIAASAEAQADIQTLYISTLGRGADTAGFTANIQALASGVPLAQLRANIVQSREGQNAIGRLYQGVLGRSADAGGSASVSQALTGGATLGQLQASLAASPEASARIGSLFQAYLGRDPSAADLVQYASALANGLPNAIMQSNLILSAENTRVVQAQYQQSLGRAANDKEVTSAKSSLFSGGTFASLKTTLDAQGRLAASIVPDRTADLTVAYQNVFGHRPVDAPTGNASTVPILQAELLLGRPFADVVTVTDYRFVSNGTTIDRYGYAVPAQYSPNGFSQFPIQESSDSTPATINVSNAKPIALSGPTLPPGPDTIVLTLAQLNMAPLSFSASIDGQPLGLATLPAAPTFGTPATGLLTVKGDFATARELDLTFGTIPFSSVYVVKGLLNGQSFLIDGALNFDVAGGSNRIGLFPHASSAGVVVTNAYPF